jgi:hypothetical protein
MEFKQRTMIRYLRLKEIKLPEMLPELKQTYDQDGHCKLDVKHWVHQFKIGRRNRQNEHGSGHPLVDDTDSPILHMPASRPFSSVHLIAEAFGYLSSTIQVQIVQWLQFMNQCICCVLCQLSDELHENRVRQSNDLLSLLGTQQEIQVCDIVIGDETWLYYQNFPTSMWHSPEDDISDR